MKRINYGSHEEWLKLRKGLIGGSEVASIYLSNSYDTAWDVWRDKTDPNYVKADNENMWWGRELEPVVAKRFAMKTGKKVVNDNHILIDDEFPFMSANIDRKIVGEKAILECKTTNSMNKKEWEDEHIPDEYYCQLQHYLGVTGYEKAYIACLLGDKTFIWKQCGRDEEFIQELRECIYNFWTYYVVPCVPPPATHKDFNNINDYYPNVEDTKDLTDMLDTFNSRSLIEEKVNEKKSELKELEIELKNYDATIKQAMENKTNAICGIYSATNKVTTQKRIDSDKLKELYPEIYKECLKESQVNRFSVKELLGV